MAKNQTTKLFTTIQSMMFTLRGMQVMLDRDLSVIYRVKVKKISEQVNQNTKKFPPKCRFLLNDTEKQQLVTNCDRLKSLRNSSVNLYAFTEQGVTMLSAILKSTIDVNVSIHIMKAFVYMRKQMVANEAKLQVTKVEEKQIANEAKLHQQVTKVEEEQIAKEAALHQRLAKIEQKQKADEQKFKQILTALNNKKPTPQQGIFQDGEVFKARVFVSNLIISANESIRLIDNYIDKTVLYLLSKKKKNVTSTIYTKRITSVLKEDVKRYNDQYPPITLKRLTKVHDRFLIIDNTAYHFGASLKDLGKELFAFSKMNEADTLNLIEKLPKEDI